MKTIRNNEAFEAMKKADKDGKNLWDALFTDDRGTTITDIPTLEGLDHISVTPKAFTFHDVGCNGRDNSFRICREV